MGISDSIQIPIIIIGTILVLLCVFSLGIYIGIITKVNKKIQALTNPVQDRKK
jgi:VIT1/CCC1 family predicted Fe2+/Mn2+ transporter